MIGVELCSEAVEDAKVNAQENGNTQWGMLGNRTQGTISPTSLRAHRPNAALKVNFDL